MDDVTTFDYTERLRADLIEQFRGQPRIEALLRVLGKQMQEVYEFFLQLQTTLDIDKSVGAQLDRIGSIVQLTRKEATALARQSSYTYTDSDDMYRMFLHYKIFLNTAECTYRDIVRSIHMLWDGEFTYHEDTDYPATIILDYEMFSGKNNRQFTNIPILKPAGVRIRFRDHCNVENKLYVGGSAMQMTKLQFVQQTAAILPLYLMDEEGNILTDELGAILCEVR